MKQRTPEQRKLQGDMLSFSAHYELMPWEQVAEKYNEKSGETLTRTRVWQLAMQAQKKLRDGLEEIAREIGVIQ